MILGACIGSLSALVQGVLQPASLRVLRGWQEGREYPLDRAASLLGRDEHADVALFRDMKIEKKHAFVRREGSRYLLVNNGAPPEQTMVNGERGARPGSSRAMATAFNLARSKRRLPGRGRAKVRKKV